MAEFEEKFQDKETARSSGRNNDARAEEESGARPGAATNGASNATVFRKLRGATAPSSKFSHVLDFPLLREAVDGIVKEAVLRVLDGKTYVAGAARDDGAVRGVGAEAADTSQQSQLSLAETCS